MFTWDEIWQRADGFGYGSAELTAKDEARYQLGIWILESEGYDIEECECPEEEIDWYLETHEAYFDENGNLL